MGLSREMLALLEYRQQVRHEKAMASVRQGRMLAEFRREKLLEDGKIPSMRVTHPVYGECVVRAESKCDAIHQAARVWECEFMDLRREAGVWRML